MTRALGGAAIIFALLGQSQALLAGSPDDLDRDVRGYVLASCLASVSDEALRSQGEVMATMVVERAKGDPTLFSSLDVVIRRELKTNGIATFHGDGPVGSTVPVPLLTCSEIEHRPPVRDAMRKARAALAKYYMTQKR